MSSGGESDLGSSSRPAAAGRAKPVRPGAVRSIGAVYEGAAGLHAYRKASAETCAISALDDPRTFRARCRIYHLGSSVLADVHSSSLRYLRSARHLAGGGYDHYQVTFNLSGRIHYRSDRQRAVVVPDDIIVIDSARETDAYAYAPDEGAAHALALFVPRAALAALHRTPGGGHLLLLSRAQSMTRVLHERLSELLENIELGAKADVHADARAFVGLLAGSLGRREPPAPAAGRRAHRPAADSLERLIERRLDSPALCLELLCTHCRCSRATVYRLLEADGGPIRYIRRRRLQRAFQELISGSVSHGRILELALRHRFASEATFNRAFRRTFGIPPGEVRDIAARSRRAARAGDARAVRALDWIRMLA